MADNSNWFDNLKPDYRVTRKMYHFPNQGMTSLTLMGTPVRLKSYEYEYPKEDPGYGKLSQCLVQAANYQKLEGSFDFEPLGFAFANYLMLRPEIGGGHRTFHAFFNSYGSVNPVDSTTVAAALKTGGEIAGALSKGPAGVVSFLLGLVSVSGSIGRIDAQAFPSHHIGLLKIEETLEGVVLEGGARTGRAGTYSAARVKSVCHIYTDDYFQYMTIAYPKWVEFYKLGHDARQHNLQMFQGYLRARDSWIQRKREHRLDIIEAGMYNQGFPDPTYMQMVHPWMIWAWERNLDVTSPPPDPRQGGYISNLNYDKKRDWFSY